VVVRVALEDRASIALLIEMVAVEALEAILAPVGMGATQILLLMQPLVRGAAAGAAEELLLTVLQIMVVLVVVLTHSVLAQMARRVLMAHPMAMAAAADQGARAVILVRLVRLSQGRTERVDHLVAAGEEPDIM